MKEAIWGVLIVALGLLGIVIVQTFQNVTVTNDQNYYLLKETTEAAMLDAVDLTYYRSTGKVRIVEDKFVENFTRRFAESAIATQDYDIVIHSVIETPPFVSVSLGTYVFSLKGDTFNIRNSIDSIIETKYSREKYEESKGDSIEFTCLTGECEVTSCINGDLRFTGWGSVALPSSQCKEGFTITDIDRNVNYQACENGKWVNKSDTTTSTHKSGTDLTYTWTYFKDSIFHDINVKTTETVAFGDCINSFTICPPGGLTIYVGENVRLTPEYNPSDAVNRELTWESSNSSVSVMGLIEAIASGRSVGNATITATSSNNKKATCKIDVIALSCPIQMLVMDSNTTEQATLINGIVPSNATWSIDNTNYATIDSNGKITSKDMPGVYYYRVVVNGKEIGNPCPFEITDPQEKELIVTCDKEDMKVYEQTSCTVKSSVTGEVLTGATLACTINNKKVEPVSNSNNTIVCSPEEVGELVVTATKATYTPGSDSVIVSETGKPTLVVNCVKDVKDTTPLSTGINFNTPITCSVSGYETADLLSFVYKSYTGVPLQTITQKEKASITITSGSTKGVLILTAKKGTQEVIKYFEVGCIPGDMWVRFNLGTDKIPAATIPTICPQYFDYRFDEDKQGYIKYYETFPKIYNHVDLCGVYGNTSPLGGEYSISGSSEDLKESKNYRSYWDNESYIFILSLGKIPPSYLSITENKYETAGYFEISYDKNDFARFGLTEEDRSLVWSTNVDPYVGNTQKSFSNTFKGVLLDEDDPFCVAFAEEYPNVKPTELVLQLERIDAENYIVPENSTARGYFLQVSKAEPELAFDRTTLGTWTSSDPSVLNVTDWLNNWGKGRITTTGKAGTATITFTSKLSEYGKMKFPGQTTKSASITLSTIESCDQLKLQFCPTARYDDENPDMECITSTNIMNNIYSNADIKLNYMSEGNFGTWSVTSSEIDNLDELGSSKNIDIDKQIKTRTITYTRTVDKCKKSITITNRQDTTPPVITVKQNGVEINEIFLLLGDHFDISSYIATATDNITPSSYFDGKITSYLLPDKLFYDNNGITIIETSGKYSLIFTAVDEMGNIATKTIPITVSQYNRRISCTTTGGTNGKWTNQSVTITGTCNVLEGNIECGDDIAGYTYGLTIPGFVGPGLYGSIATVYDKTKTVSATCPADQTVWIDKVRPDIIVTQQGSVVTFDNVIPILYEDIYHLNINISASDSGGSGLTSPSYTSNLDSVINDINNKGAGTYYLTITAKDNANNETKRTITINVSKKEFESLMCNISRSGTVDSWTNKDVSITYSCSVGSGNIECASTTPIVDSYTYTGTYTSGGYKFCDKNGKNCTTCTTYDVMIDKTKPVCVPYGGPTPTSYGWVKTTGFTVYASCTDSGGSGCVNDVDEEEKVYGTGTQTASFTVSDKAGNTSNTCSKTFNIDTTKPTVTSSYTSTGWSNSDVNVTLTCTDGESGCVTSSKEMKFPKTGTQSWTFSDKAGNETPFSQYVRIDKVIPSVSISGKNYSNSDVTLTANVSNISEIKSGVSYQWSEKGFEITGATGSTYIAKDPNYSLATYNYSVKVTTGSGNASEDSHSIQFDNEAPKCLNLNIDSNCSTKKYSIYFKCSDNSGTCNYETLVTRDIKDNSYETEIGQIIYDLALNKTSCKESVVLDAYRQECEEQ